MDTHRLISRPCTHSDILYYGIPASSIFWALALPYQIILYDIYFDFSPWSLRYLHGLIFTAPDLPAKAETYFRFSPFSCSFADDHNSSRGRCFDLSRYDPISSQRCKGSCNAVSLYLDMDNFSSSLSVFEPLVISWCYCGLPDF